MRILECRNVTKIYGGNMGEASTTALSDISIKIEEGEFIAVMGPSGSGKSTLLNILSCTDKSTSGDVIINEKEVDCMNEDEMALFKRRNIGFVFQDFNLLDSLNLRENIMLPLILDGIKAEVMEKKAEEIMKMFGIEDIKGKYPYNISGGQQQRAAVARAVMNDPLIIFADEPTGNLDSKSSRTVMECFAQMNETLKTTIMIVTHDAFAASHANRVLFIKDGNVHMEIVKSGNRKNFFDKILNCVAVIGEN